MEPAGPSGSSTCTISSERRSYSFHGVSAFPRPEYVIAWYRNCIPVRLPFRIDKAMRTRFAAATILGMVLIFILAVAGTLIAKSRIPPTEPAGSVASSADLRIKEAQIEEVSGGVRWRL